MRLVIPHGTFELRSESDRMIIDTHALAENDRELDRKEVARRLGKSVRMVDVYRRLTGEARLHSEWRGHRTIIRESELKRWLIFLNKNKNLNLAHHFDGSIRSLRPRQTRRRGMEGRRRSLPSVATA
jgi:hypothetical protein